MTSYRPYEGFLCMTKCMIGILTDRHTVKAIRNEHVESYAAGPWAGLLYSSHSGVSRKKDLNLYLKYGECWKFSHNSTPISKRGKIGSMLYIHQTFQVFKMEKSWYELYGYGLCIRENPMCFKGLEENNNSWCGGFVKCDWNKPLNSSLPKRSVVFQPSFFRSYVRLHGFIRGGFKYFLPIFKEDFQFDYITCFRWVETTNQETTWKIYQKTWQVPGLKGFRLKWNKNIHQHLQRDAN